MADEKRHARIIGQFAEAKGETVKDHPPVQRAARSLADIARENAVEGCVRESYGALVAMWQARSAADPELREAMAHIAEDESRHAALAWHVAAWAESRLTAEENARIAEAKHEAERDLAAEIATMEETDATRWLGIPSSRDGAHLHAALANYRAQA